MPIDYNDYHPDWKNIRRQILDQADHKCEFCGVPNGAVGVRTKDGEFWEFSGDWGAEAKYHDGTKPIRIVLTIAHLNHNKADNEPSNLRALCQKCHLNWDREHHAKNAAATRRQRKVEQGQGVLL